MRDAPRQAGTNGQRGSRIGGCPLLQVGEQPLRAVLRGLFRFLDQLVSLSQRLERLREKSFYVSARPSLYTGAGWSGTRMTSSAVETRRTEA
jgi:hypothetical protein